MPHIQRDSVFGFLLTVKSPLCGANSAAARCVRRPAAWPALCGIAGAALLAAAAVTPAAAQTAHLLGATSTLGSGFRGPQAVAVDGAGNVYVADTNNFTVKKIPYSGGSYGTPVTLPISSILPEGVAVDGVGNVYVTDHEGDGVYEIPYNGGNYSTPVYLAGFNSPTSVAVDGVGNVYVADTVTSAIYEIPYNGGSYGSPVTLPIGSIRPAGVAVDGAGNLYVADTNNSAIEEIPFSGGSYSTPVTLASGFNYPAGVAVDGAGNLYVTDFADNAVDEIPYSGGSYGPKLRLGSGFNGPSGAAVDGAGNVYFIDNDGNVEKIELAIDFGAANVGVAASTQTIAFSIDAAGTLGSPSMLTQGAAGQDFTDAGTGSCSTNGAGHTYNAGDTCTVVVNFTPKAPGTRQGAVVLVNGSGAALAAAYLRGTGNGAQVTFQPGTTAALRSGLSYSQAVAVDGAGNLYVADFFNNAVKKVPYSGGSYGTPVTLASSFNEPYGIAVDGAGNVYVADPGDHAVKEIPYSAGSYGAPVALGSGFGYPTGVAVDGTGNLYVADEDHNAVEKVPYIGGSYGAPVKLGSGFNDAQRVAVDGAGNVFVADTINNAIKEIPYLGGSYGTPVTLLSGIEQPGGVAVDGADNVYVADINNNAVKEIPYSGGSYGTPVTLGSGFSSPTDVAVDSAGNVYVATYDQNGIEKIDLADAPGLTFANTALGSTSDAHTVTVANTGNAALTFPVPASGDNPSLSSNFSRSDASTCPLVTSSSSTAATLAAGASCTEVLAFAPALPGNITGSLMLTDNAGNPSSTVTQSIALSGTATGKITTTITTAPTASALTYGQTLAASTLTGGAASVPGSFAWTTPATVPSLGTASYPVTFTPSDTTDYSTATAMVSVTVANAPPTNPPDFNFAGGSTQQSQTVTPGGAATYTFDLSPQNGSYPGPVSFTVKGLPPGATYTLTPSSIAQNGGAQTVKLSITTSSAQAVNRVPAWPWESVPAMTLLLPFCLRRKTRDVLRAKLTVVLFVAAGIGMLTGCGSGTGNQAAANYTITVTATSGTVQHTETVMLTVQ